MANVQGRAKRTKERLGSRGTATYFGSLPFLTLSNQRFVVRSEFGNSSGPSSREMLRSLRLLALSLSILTLIGSGPIQSVPAVSSDPVSNGLTWLTSHQQSNGSYGSFSEPQTAPAMYALWIGLPSSPSVVLGFSFLKNQLQNSTSWFWGGGGNIAEADVPGEILYTFAATHNLAMLNRLSSVTANLTKFQQPNGGFLGYLDTSSGKQVTSSVDTAMALWGLIGAKSISSTNEQSGINYLLSLQNSDGSFNLTSTVRSNSLYSLGPEPISITALVLLVLHDASLASSNPHVVLGLGYLYNALAANFSGHVYAASLSALALAAFSEPIPARQSVNYVVSQQNPDGGFRDIIRSGTVSEALDTGWSTAALQIGGTFLSAPVANGSRVFYT